MSDDDAESLDYRDGEDIALAIVRAFDLVARTHPGKLRTALALVYDQQATEGMLRLIDSRVAAALARVDAAVQTARDMEAVVQGVIEGLEGRADALEVRLDKAARAFDQLARLARQLARNLNPPAANGQSAQQKAVKP